MRHGTDPRGAVRAKLFWNGRSQAVRLPRAFRFEGDEVEIRKEGDAVILEPVKKRAWPEGYWDWLERHHADLDLGDVEPMPVAFLDLVTEEEA